MPVTPNPILDMDSASISNVQSMVRFELLDRDLQWIGAVKPLAASSISFTSSGTVNRTMDGVSFSELEMRDINPFTDRIRPYWVLGDGTEWPMGAFCFTSVPLMVSSGMGTIAAVMADQGFLLNTDSSRTYSLNSGGRLLDLIEHVLDDVGISRDQRILPDNASVAVLGPIGWPAGTPRLRIISECCAMANWLPPYFDNLGRFVIRRPPDLAHATADVSYDNGAGRIIANSIVSNENLLDAPNVFQVVCSGPTGGAIVGRARVDPNLPYSVERSQRERVQTTFTQGLLSTAQAQGMAETQAAAAPGYRTISFSAFPDPRHDGFMVVQYGGELYRELSWSLQLTAGGPHSHELTKGGFPAAG